MCKAIEKPLEDVKIEEDKQITDDPIIGTIGQLGKYQIITSVAMLMANFGIALHQLSIIFLAPHGQNNHTCRNSSLDVCSIECKEIDYDRSTFDETIVTQWGLVCNKEYLANLSQTILMLGALFGNLGFGSLADKFGRRIPLHISSALTVIFGVSIAFAPSFWLFCVLRFFVGASTGGLAVICFVIIMESVGPKWRETFAVMYELPFNLGHLGMAGMSYILRDWKDLQLAIAAFSFANILYIFIISESPVWLFSTGKLEQAERVLKHIVKFNQLPEEDIEKKLQQAYDRKLEKTEGENGSFFDLFRFPNMRIKTFCLCFSCFSLGITFFGVVQFVGNITEHIFLNVGISAIMCIPGSIVTIFFCKYWGRKCTLIMAEVITGGSLLIIAVLPNDQGTLRVICSSFGIFGASVAFPTVYLYSAELFPTVIRNAGVGLASMMTRVGSMIAPIIVSLSDVNPIIAPLVFGCIPLLAAVLCYALPETKGRELPSTMKEGEEFTKKKVKEVV